MIKHTSDSSHAFALILSEYASFKHVYILVKTLISLKYIKTPFQCEVPLSKTQTCLSA